jgi:hypothetical protein
MSATMLTRNAFEAARRFIESSARPLEQACFQHTFDGGPGQDIISALAAYQNPDGGFGRALEPDLRAPESSALCTSIALRVLREYQLQPTPEMLTAALEYLFTTFNERNLHWRIIPPSAQESPHAPWWDQAGREAGFEDFSLNPDAEILGYLIDHHSCVPAGMIERLQDCVDDYLAGLRQIEMHELLCCLRLLETPGLPRERHDALFKALSPLVDGILEYDPAAWHGYSLRPLQVVRRPGSPFMPGRRSSVAANLAFEIESQGPDGAWEPAWSWGEAYPDEWAITQREWSGVLTLENLLLFQRYNAIEGLA